MPFDTGLLTPAQDGHRCQLGAIVRHERRRPAAPASCSFSIPLICSSEKREGFIHRLLRDGPYPNLEKVQGLRSEWVADVEHHCQAANLRARLEVAKDVVVSHAGRREPPNPIASRFSSDSAIQVVLNDCAIEHSLPPSSPRFPSMSPENCD